MQNLIHLVLHIYLVLSSSSQCLSTCKSPPKIIFKSWTRLYNYKSRVLWISHILLKIKESKSKCCKATVFLVNSEGSKLTYYKNNKYTNCCPLFSEKINEWGKCVQLVKILKTLHSNSGTYVLKPIHFWKSQSQSTQIHTSNLEQRIAWC